MEKTNAIPIPVIANGAMSSAKGVVGSMMSVIQPMPIACIIRPAAKTGRVPTRVAMSPATGAKIMGIPVHGRVRAPASKGPNPCAVWKYWLMRKIAPMRQRTSRKRARSLY